MSLADKFKKESKLNLTIGNIEDVVQLETTILEEVEMNFHNGKASKLSQLNRRYNSVCLKIASVNLSAFLDRLVDTDKIFVITNAQRASRVVPFSDWIDAYEYAQEKGDAGIQLLNEKYLEG